MLLVADAGNSNIVFALMEGERELATWRHPTASPVTAKGLKAAFEKAGIKPERVAAGILGSVVPKAVKPLQDAFKTLIKHELQIFKPTDPNLGITLAVDKPDKIGADRVANAIAGIHYYGAPLIVIDFGTATTFTVVDKNLAIQGGAIAAGIETSLKTLSEAGANLPEVGFGYQGPVIGKNTIDAMGSGAFFGALSLVEGMVARISREFRTRPMTVATGGLSLQFAGKTKAIDHYRPDLTVQGLRLAYERTTSP